MARSFIALIALVALSMFAFGHGHKLALEKATLGSHARIYSYAKETKMHVPTGKEIVILS